MKPRNEQLLKMLILKIERIGSFYNELDKKERATNLIKDDLNKTSDTNKSIKSVITTINKTLTRKTLGMFLKKL
jgi:hypothetical protein